MAGRTGEREAARSRGLDRGAGRQQRRLEGRLGDERVRVDPAACRADALDQRGRVTAQDVID
jgi:hypothetical protein